MIMSVVMIPVPGITFVSWSFDSACHGRDDGDADCSGNDGCGDGDDSGDIR